MGHIELGSSCVAQGIKIEPVCVPAMYLMEPMSLKAGTHEETIQFIVTPKVAETMILGLAWLRKWNLVGWKDNKWHLRSKGERQ